MFFNLHPRLVLRLALLTGLGPVLPVSGQAPPAPSPIPHVRHAQWQSPLPTGYSLNALAAPNDSTAYVVGDHGTALKTTNRGRTWRVLDTGPGPSKCNLRFVTFGDAQRGWVGYNTPITNQAIQYFTGRGEVRRTTDGGLTWTRQSLGDPRNSVRIHALQAISPTEAFVVYDAISCRVGNPCGGLPPSYLRHTTDGGVTWRLVGPAPDGVYYNFQFLSSTVAYAVSPDDNFGAYGVIKTTDGGVTWRGISPDSLRRGGHTLLSFQDAQHGWISRPTVLTGGTDTLLYYTSNGGQTWQPRVLTGATAPLQHLTFSDAQHGLLVYGAGSASGQFLTADGGQTWTPAQDLLLPSTNRPTAVRLTAGGTAWVAGAWGAVGVSTDRGNTWRPATTTLTTTHLRRVQVFDATHSWAVGRGDTVLLHTRHRGEAPWQRVSLTRAPLVNWQVTGGYLGAQDASFVDRDTGYVYVQAFAGMGSAHWVLKTTDGGRQWSTHALPVPGALTLYPFRPPSLAFVTARRGVFAAGAGLLLVTQDGGQSWQQPPSGTTQNFYDVTWADSLTARAVADSGVVVTTTDGGYTWTAGPPQALFFAGDYYRYAFSSALAGCRSRGFDAPDFTTDGGATWQVSLVDSATGRLGTTPLVYDPAVFTISPLANRRGWAFGINDFYRTRDGGRSWQRAAIVGAAAGQTPTTGAAADFYNAWAVGEGGQILRYAEKYIQTDSAAAQPRAYCGGDTVQVAFATTGTFAPTEQDFRVELSNPTGRFRPGHTTVLPLVGGAAASPLRAVLPVGVVAGTGYRLRVIRADSSVLGGDNAHDLTLRPRPAPVMVAPADPARFRAGDSEQPAAPAGYGQYRWLDGDTTRTRWVRAAGTYAVAVAAGGGCFGAESAPVVVRQTPVPLAPGLAQTGTAPVTLTATPPLPGATYSWTRDGQPVAGATGTTLVLTTPAQSGTYAVRVSRLGCASPPSAALTVIVTGLAAEPTAATLRLAPNPADAAVGLTLTGGAQLARATLLDMTGRVSLATALTGEQAQLDVRALPAGLYVLRVHTTTGASYTRRLQLLR